MGRSPQNRSLDAAAARSEGNLGFSEPRLHPLLPLAQRVASITAAARASGSVTAAQTPLVEPATTPVFPFNLAQMRSLVPWPIRRIFRVVWWLACICTLVALPLVFWEFQKRDYDVRYQAWFVGGIFVILSFPISLYEVAMHTEYYTQPALQRHVIRILWMVPIYAIDAWFALRFTNAREYLDPIRECYEAYVIWSFLAYLTAYLEGTVGDLEKYRSNEPPVKHAWGMQFFASPWKQGGPFLWECRKGVLNYVILRPVVTVLQIITSQFGVYGQGEFNPAKAYIYLSTITSISQGWSLYCLVMLYSNYHKELAPLRPLAKFLCVKAVIFLSFWQGIVISALVSFKVIQVKQWTTYDEQDVAAGIQDFLICVEMFFAALAHTYAFPPRDYMDPSRPTPGFFTNVRYIFDFRDVVDEVQEVLGEHMDNATEGLQQVARLPQQAMQKAVGFVGARTHKSGSEPSSEVDVALLDADDIESGHGADDRHETLPHIANLDILPVSGFPAPHASAGGSPTAAAVVPANGTTAFSPPPFVNGPAPRANSTITARVPSSRQQPSRPTPECHRLASEALSFVSASENSVAQMEAGTLPSFPNGTPPSFSADGAPSLGKPSFGGGAPPSFSDASFGSAPSYSTALGSERFASASAFQPPPVVNRGSGDSLPAGLTDSFVGSSAEQKRGGQ